MYFFPEEQVDFEKVPLPCDLTALDVKIAEWSRTIVTHFDLRAPDAMV